uniref:Protein kinase domain-containing protein n=1 Tax=Leersia perrieri TaxID=77586 RepID=A0A0D9XN79_9ORYZ
MEACSIRVAYIIVFCFLVSARFGFCAPHSEEGRALLKYTENERDKSISSLSNWGEMRMIGRALNLLLKENMLSSGTPSELKDPSTISEFAPDGSGGFEPCRKCLAKSRTVHNATPRKLLQARELISNQTHEHHKKKQSPPPVQSSASHLRPHWAIYALSTVGVLCIAAVATAIYVLFSRRKKDNTVMPWATGLSGQLKKAFVTGVPSLERTELEAACEGFINVIGTLPECTLYKGTLSSGVEIAVLSTSVKSTQQWSAQSEERFRNKISVLSKVNHKNFMNLLGYCTCEEPFTRMMVFEYAPCGSLFEHLHIREAEHLDWKTRLRIIMGVAYCLEHMIQLDPPPLLPTNLSSSSIYLTEDNAAKIADIEFWKDSNKQDASSQEIKISSSRGDDQESALVYKFGILLLEVISGRRPFSEDVRLMVLWASSYLDGKRPLSAMVDRTLVRSSSAAPEKDVAALCDVVRQCMRQPGIRMGEVARLIKIGLQGCKGERKKRLLAFSSACGYVQRVVCGNISGGNQSLRAKYKNVNLSHTMLDLKVRFGSVIWKNAFVDLGVGSWECSRLLPLPHFSFRICDPMATASSPAAFVQQDYHDEEDDEFQDDDDDLDDDDDGDDDQQEPSPSPSDGADEARLQSVLRRLTADEVPIRVHDVQIRGCCRTRRATVEAAIGSDLPRAATVRDLVRAAAKAGDRIRRLGAFDTVSITLDAAPPGIPGGAAVVVFVDVAEARGRSAGELGIFAHTGSRSCLVEGSVKLKNLFGYCETWDASGNLGLDQTMELSTGLAIPRIEAIPTPLVARMSFLSEDWLKSSLKEQMMGISVGLLSTMNHNLAYNLSWQSITDQALMSSSSIRGQLGHSLLSSIKYTYKVDQRDSSIRPTHGYAFLFSSQVGGLAPEKKDARYIRQVNYCRILRQFDHDIGKTGIQFNFSLP